MSPVLSVLQDRINKKNERGELWLAVVWPRGVLCHTYAISDAQHINSVVFSRPYLPPVVTQSVGSRRLQGSMKWKWPIITKAMTVSEGGYHNAGIPLAARNQCCPALHVNIYFTRIVIYLCLFFYLCGYYTRCICQFYMQTSALLFSSCFLLKLS